MSNSRPTIAATRDLAGRVENFASGRGADSEHGYTGDCETNATHQRRRDRLHSNINSEIC